MGIWVQVWELSTQDTKKSTYPAKYTQILFVNLVYIPALTQVRDMGR
jgi:hypothetical protein